MVGPVQQHGNEHCKEDREVEVDVEPPRPGRAGVKCKEIDPAAEDQEGILDTVEVNQGEGRTHHHATSFFGEIPLS